MKNITIFICNVTWSVDYITQNFGFREYINIYR
jgi:hypothetical protein